MTCPTCHGAGSLGVCANDGKAGCSHINDDEWPCPDCESPAVTDLTEPTDSLPDPKGQEPA